MVGTRHYCTLFDRRYLARALALYRSLEDNGGDFVLRAVCMDAQSADLLRRLSPPRMPITSIEEVERSDPGLRLVRPSRNSYEYCWTATPAVCRYFIRAEPQLDMITYLDADLHFSSSPELLFAELGDGSVLLIPHRTAPLTEDVVGVYNVGWLTFRHDANGVAALDWWREACLDWCFDRLEPMRYGDQKYLDGWPTRFGGVKVSGMAAAGLAPWNESRHVVVDRGPAHAPLVDGAPLIFYHHAGLRVHRSTPILRAFARCSSAFQSVDGPVEIVFTLSSDPGSPAVKRVRTAYLDAVAHALGELATVSPHEALPFDAPNIMGAAKSIASRRMPTVVASGYRRLPIKTRYAVSRSVLRRGADARASGGGK